MKDSSIGWEMRRNSARQKAMGIVPQDTAYRAFRRHSLMGLACADHKKVAAHMMEVYAAALSYVDDQMGRILDAIQDMGELDNALVIYIQGDNGASAEGTEQGLFNEMSIANAVPETSASCSAAWTSSAGR